MSTFPIFRGLILVLAFTWGVPLFSLAVLKTAEGFHHGGLMNAGFGLVLTWTLLFLPHLAVVPVPYGESTAIVLALSQWAITGAVVGHLTRSLGHLRALIVAIISVAALSLATHAVIRAIGYRVIVEGP